MADDIHSSTSAHGVEVERDDDGHRRLVATEKVAASEEILAIQGVVRPTPTRFSVQIGPRRHLDEMGPVDATNHSCDPSAFVDFSDPARIVLRALRDLSAGDEISIHYCATEYDMAAPFECGCGSDSCVGFVRGYRYLPETDARALSPWISPAVRTLSSLTGAA